MYGQSVQVFNYVKNALGIILIVVFVIFFSIYFSLGVASAQLLVLQQYKQKSGVCFYSSHYIK